MQCPLCKHPNDCAGRLGQARWFNCRACGAWYHGKLPPAQPVTIKPATREQHERHALFTTETDLPAPVRRSVRRKQHTST